MRKALTVAAVLLWATGAAAQPSPTSVRLVAQAQADLAGAARDLWPGWDQTPFGVLLIEDEREHLICHPTNPPGFSPPVRHAALGCNVQSRARVFPRGLLAAMPAFGLPATVVVGAPAATGKSDTAWRATLLHEHFHQHQWTFPRYGERTAALGLSGGDGTGMWMLNYAFPYAQPGVAGRFAEAASILERALAS